MTLSARKAAARKAGFARRAAAHAGAGPGTAGVLSSVLAGYRGSPLAGYLPIRSEISPLSAMAEAAAHGPVGVPVITEKNAPLQFSRWEPDTMLREGPFGVKIPITDDFLTPKILIVPLVAWTRKGERLGYGGGFYDRTLELLREGGPVLAIGFAYSGQEAESLPMEPTDQPLDMLVTEAGVIKLQG